MKSLIKVLMVLALGAVICLPSVASATISLLGNYGGYENWPPTISTPYSGNIDRMDVYITEGTATFASPYLGDPTGYPPLFSTQNFTATYISDTEVMGTTTTVGGVAAVNYDVFFDGSSTILPLTLDTNYFLDGLFVCHETLSFPSSGGYIDTYDLNQVPLPPSALLMGSGLLGLVGLGWRRRQTS